MSGTPEAPLEAPEIVMVTSESLPADFVQDQADALEQAGIRIATGRSPRGPFAGLELLLPSAVMLIVGTAYFTGFAQKAGEHHYEVLRTVAKALWMRMSKVRVTMIGTPGKVSDNPRFSLSYSITGGLGQGAAFKLVFRTDLEEAEMAEGVDAFLDFLKDLHRGELDEERIAPLLTYRPIGGTILVTFDGATGRIVGVDPLADQRGED
jgi:hypothetical protein